MYFNTSNEAAGISDDKMLIADVPKVTPEPPIDSVLTGPQLVMPMDDVGVHCQYEVTNYISPFGVVYCCSGCYYVLLKNSVQLLHVICCCC